MKKQKATQVKLNIKNDMKKHFRAFYIEVFGPEAKDNEKYNEAITRIDQMVDICEKKGVRDYDMMVSVKYRIGRKANTKSFIEEQPSKRMIDVIWDGFDIPCDVSYIEIKVVPALLDGNNMKELKDPIFETKFGIGKEQNLTEEQMERRYGLTLEDMVLSVDDLKNNRILRFYDHNINQEL